MNAYILENHGYFRDMGVQKFLDRWGSKFETVEDYFYLGSREDQLAEDVKKNDIDTFIVSSAYTNQSQVEDIVHDLFVGRFGGTHFTFYIFNGVYYLNEWLHRQYSPEIKGAIVALVQKYDVFDFYNGDTCDRVLYSSEFNSFYKENEQPTHNNTTYE